MTTNTYNLILSLVSYIVNDSPEAKQKQFLYNWGGTDYLGLTFREEADYNKWMQSHLHYALRSISEASNLGYSKFINYKFIQTL